MPVVLLFSCPTSRASEPQIAPPKWRLLHGCFEQILLDLLPPAPLPPVQRQDAQQMFLQHKGGTHRSQRHAKVVSNSQARKRHINTNFLVRLLLGRPRECPRDKPGFSLGQAHFVLGTNPGFLAILHNRSPVCPWDKPSLCPGQSRGRRAAQKVYVLKVYVPFSLANFL